MSPDTYWFEGGNCTPHCCNFSFMHVWMVTRATINRPGPLASRNPASCTFFPCPRLNWICFSCSENGEATRFSVHWMVAAAAVLVRAQRRWHHCLLRPPAAAGFYVICPLSCIVPNFCFCLNRWMEPRCRNTVKKVGKWGGLNWFIVGLIPLSLCSFNDSFHNGIYIVSSQYHVWIMGGGGISPSSSWLIKEFLKFLVSLLVFSSPFVCVHTPLRVLSEERKCLKWNNTDWELSRCSELCWGTKAQM